MNIGYFNIAPTQPIAVIGRKVKHKHIKKDSTFPLSLITSLRPPLGGLPLETIQPLATWTEAWKAIPGVSNWVLGIIKWGYTLQFARRPLQFGGVVSTSVQQDWFFSLDLKDAYFHIQIAPQHRRFLWFAFVGVAYQYTVLLFGLSLAPRTFKKCMDAALSWLRQTGIHILNYLGDWLILAQSEDEFLSHRSGLLSHLECLGLWVNFAKSALSPSQRISFLRTVIDWTRR